MYILYCAQTRRATLLLQVQPRWTDREEKKGRKDVEGVQSAEAGREGREGGRKERPK